MLKRYNSKLNNKNQLEAYRRPSQRFPEADQAASGRRTFWTAPFYWRCLIPDRIQTPFSQFNLSILFRPIRINEQISIIHQLTPEFAASPITAIMRSEFTATSYDWTKPDQNASQCPQFRLGALFWPSQQSNSKFWKNVREIEFNLRR